MPSLQRRFEVLLPKPFNDGQEVPDEYIADTLAELRARYTAVSWETQVIRGIWENAKQTYHDDLMRVFVDVADTVENHQFFVDLKERLKVRFRQIDIRITTYLIDAL